MWEKINKSEESFSYALLKRLAVSLGRATQDVSRKLGNEGMQDMSLRMQGTSNQTGGPNYKKDNSAGRNV